jgi:hypothetical protein
MLFCMTFLFILVVVVIHCIIKLKMKQMVKNGYGAGFCFFLLLLSDEFCFFAFLIKFQFNEKK